MQPVRQLVRIKHGSHLYGTSTPASDQDFKGVHLPSGHNILLGRAEDVIDRGMKVSDTVKNQAGDLDEQSFSLQKFLLMLAAGDTVATEILFAPPEMITYADPVWVTIQEYGKQTINRKCKGFVGYCQRQAAKYGIKGSRMAAVKQLRDLLQEAVSTYGTGVKCGAIVDTLRDFARSHKHSDWVNIPNPNGSEHWHIECCDRKVGMSVSLKEAFDIYNKVWVNYGARAQAAMDNDGIDWKAMSHAVRVARQAHELLTMGKITFPRPDAAELLDIKLGRFPYSDVGPLLERLVAEVEAATLTSDLPAETDRELVDDVVFMYYKLQVSD